MKTSKPLTGSKTWCEVEFVIVIYAHSESRAGRNIYILFSTRGVDGSVFFLSPFQLVITYSIESIFDRSKYFLFFHFKDSSLASSTSVPNGWLIGKQVFAQKQSGSIVNSVVGRPLMSATIMSITRSVQMWVKSIYSSFWIIVLSTNLVEELVWYIQFRNGELIRMALSIFDVCILVCHLLRIHCDSCRQFCSICQWIW